MAKSEQGVQLSDDEVHEAEERALPRAAIVFETIRREGEGELDRSLPSLGFSGLAAGLSMGFSFFTTSVLHAALPAEPWRPLVENFGYTIGFLIVILGRQQLFTENTLTPILVLLNCFDRGTFSRVVRLWAIVLAANVLGAYLFAALLAHAHVFDAALIRAFGDLARRAAHMDAQAVLVRGVYAGWLIALMVWLLPAAETAAIWIIMIVTYIVGAAQLAHIIAGSVDVLYALQIGAIGWADFWLRFLLPVFAGNCIGGVTFVALLNFGQVAGDAPRKSAS